MSNVTNTDRMFQGASSFNQDIGGWNTSKFYDVSGMFDSASDFNQDIALLINDWQMVGKINEKKKKTPVMFAAKTGEQCFE